MERVTMPQLGETVTEGTIVRWLKQAGDEVAVDDVLFEVSTDKVDTEVPSAFAGFLREVYVHEGDTVPIGTLLAVVTDTADEAVDAAPEAAATDARPVRPQRRPALRKRRRDRRAPGRRRSPPSPGCLGANGAGRASGGERLPVAGRPAAAGRARPRGRRGRGLGPRRAHHPGRRAGRGDEPQPLGRPAPSALPSPAGGPAQPADVPQPGPDDEVDRVQPGPPQHRRPT